VLDPADNNKVVASMSVADIDGQPYAGFSSPDGKYLYFSTPPNRLAKIDTDTWKVVQSIAIPRRPLWTAFSLDGKWAWVSNSASDKVAKIQRGMASGEQDKVVTEIAVGTGPYGLRMSADDKEVWVADKGEGKPTPGSMITVIDAETNMIKRNIQTDCLSNDHIIASPDGAEMWATCNASHEVVVLDAKTYEIKTRIPMPNQGDSHGGVFVSYPRGANGAAEVLSDQNGLQGSALDAALKRVPRAVAGVHNYANR
jgi:DNA-binding beta-propeller fold protein YncE